MKFSSLLIEAILLAIAHTSLAAEGSLGGRLAGELARGCKSEVVGQNPKANTKATDDYCACYGNKLAPKLDDNDVVALAGGRETPHFEDEANKAVALCERRLVKSVAEATLSNAKFDELPDVSPDHLKRTKSGVFVGKPDDGTWVLMDSDQMYMMAHGELVCGWVGAPIGKSGTRQAMDEFKAVGPVLARAFLNNSDAQITKVEEFKVRNHPVVVMEVHGRRASRAGQPKDMVGMVGATFDIANRAVVSGVCFTDADRYDMLKTAMREMSLSAISARKYKD